MQMVAPPMNSVVPLTRLFRNMRMILMDWYEMNYLKPNPDKWHLLLSETGEDITLSIEGKYILNI